jgi:hypothetical protein
MWIKTTTSSQQQAQFLNSQQRPHYNSREGLLIAFIKIVFLLYQPE